MKRKPLAFGEKILTEDLGGKLGEEISKLRGLPFICAMSASKKCNSEQKLDEFRGYRHSDGLPNKEGRKYWLYWECPGCGHDWSYQHLKTRVLGKNN